MFELEFRSLSETAPGDAWRQLFARHWPAYREWLRAKGALSDPSLAAARARMKRDMPEYVPIYERLCDAVDADETAQKFLTGYRPPAYISGCSQAAWTKSAEPLLVRNYDYHPDLSEGTVLKSAWSGRPVMGVGDCLSGLVDGMNADGLVVSITFGGRRGVGDGFGIPFIVRYVLECCGDVPQAVEALERVPSHMAYNVMVLDRSGAVAVVEVGPDRPAVVRQALLSTNHQGDVDWPEHAAFSRTLERAAHLQRAIEAPDQSAQGIIDEFLCAPLFNTRYGDGFGTLYTAAYEPGSGRMTLRWPGRSLEQSFDDFVPSTVRVSYADVPVAPDLPPVTVPEPEQPAPASIGLVPDADYWVRYGQAWASGQPTDLARHVAESIVNAIGLSDLESRERLRAALSVASKRRGQVPWELLADLWAGLGGHRA